MKRLFRKSQNINTKSRGFQIFIYVIIALIIVSFFYVRSEKVFDAAGDSVPGTKAISLEGNSIISQDMTVDVDRMTAFSILFGTSGTTYQGRLLVTLYEDTSCIQQWNYAGNLEDNAFHAFYLTRALKIQPDKHYSFTVSAIYDGESNIALWVGDKNATPVAYMNGVEMPDNTVCYQVIHTNTALRNLVLIIATVFLLIIMLLIIFRVNEVIIMSVILVTVSFAFYWLCPLGMVSDEQFHFYRAYEISCGGMTSVRYDDEVSGDTLPSALRDFNDKDATIDWNDTSIIEFRTMVLYSPASYLPQAIGIKIASLFTDHPMALFYAARLGGLLACLFLCIFALYKIPFGKKVIFLVMMFPVSIQSRIAIAPDGFTLALAMTLFAYVLYICNREKKLMWKDIAILAPVCILLSLCKIIYVILILLLFIIPKEKIEDRRKRIMLKIVIPAVAIILNLIWLMITSQYMLEFQPGVNSGAQVKYILTHIPQYCLIAVRTIMRRGTNWIGEMIGTAMGAFTIPINALVWITFLILFIYEILRSHEEVTAVHKYEKFIVMFTFLGGVALTFTSLYVQWTPYANEVINGIQGRYFTPLISLLAFFVMYVIRDRKVREGNFVARVAKGTYYYVIIVVLNGITILEMIKYYIASFSVSIN